ncbi:MAG: COX15/CtaA family protein [Balneolales bacterium]
MNRTDSQGWQRMRVIWLFSGCVMIAVILVVGGLTRLNQAGLSITEWDVIQGVIPPLTESQWDEVFEIYRQFPEYREIHKGISIAEFKIIYWWEYTHRMLSRLLGMLFLIPFVIFVWKRAMPAGDAVKLGGIALLGGIQAFLGWYMVQSGLANQPVVSHLRLGIHLVVAFLLFYFLWTMAINRIPGLSRDSVGNQNHDGQSHRMYHIPLHRLIHPIIRTALVLLFLQVLMGGWTAGLKAGYVYPTFPKMGEFWIPPELGFMSPWWFDISHNAISVQFFHRLLALLLTLFVIPPIVAGFRSSARPLRLTGFILLLIMSLQILTGALNVLWGVPVWISSVHQFGALMLMAALLTWRRYWNVYGCN